jgi:peptide chain release factor 1
MRAEVRWRLQCRWKQAMRILRARLLAAAQEQADAAASDARRSQVRMVDRSERIRTYNFP